MKTLSTADSPPKKIEDRIKSFKDACDVNGINQDEVVLFELVGVTERDREVMSAQYQLIIIARALNEGWTPDWSEDNQKKWYPYFEWNKNKSGFVFSCTGYVITYTGTTVGSRLCFKSEELAEYAGKRFEKIYAKLLNP